MKILHFGKHYWPHHGGMEIALRDLSEAGVRLGHDVRCVVSASGTESTRGERIEGVDVKRLVSHGKLLSTPLCPGFFWENIDPRTVVHIHLPNPFAEFALLARLSVSKRKELRLVPFLHALPVSQKWIGRIWFALVTSRILKAADRILVSNKSFAAEFPVLTPFESKFHVLPFQTHCWSGDRLALTEEARRASRRVVAVGRLVPYKGFDVLIRAWGKLSRSGRLSARASLILIGDGPEKSRLMQIALEEGVRASVVFRGAVSDEEKEKVIETAALLAAPSLNSAETFGISILEAMGRGLPVVTTRLSTGVAILARDGACGAAVQPGSVDELTEALGSLLGDEQRRLEVGRQNLAFAQSHFSGPVLIANYGTLLKELAA